MSAITPIHPFSGFGLGLRTPHYADFLQARQPVDFVEIISENFMIEGGRPLWVLDQICQAYPVCMHGVSMSLGASDGLNPAYLSRLRALANRIEPLWVSDHLCWTGIGGTNSHDLLPLPLTGEALERVCRNIDQAQTALGRNLLIENPSTYVTFPEDSYTEWDFLSEVCKRSGCELLLDINNIYVSAHNHGFKASDYIDGIPAARVRQIHLAGHSTHEALLIDTHDQPVPDGVWDLLERLYPRLDQVAVMIERDDNIPPLADLLAEVAHARDIASRTVSVTPQAEPAE
ncbi:DUF692 domain-containing protein [Asticcacaulis benevestitus]|uniref:UPF0276 protein ABENE_09615 n=1 Tax=Asticcacaulis benevestitus DSM 16100 = ATCC BAA-896 TaxID=1121022 RepID=V4PU40_9CAUL|nr:DUF692 domain-containing protein [Asticcacaulis benevestitus]ESQ91881.1 hypothetical protein ABENE_09615 [Asticcacaulis benevestitus DSM 16100 = ATCC BAA-896]